MGPALRSWALACVVHISEPPAKLSDLLLGVGPAVTSNTVVNWLVLVAVPEPSLMNVLYPSSWRALPSCQRDSWM